jgi:RNA polymerase sigma factor (sigma-70 family)
LEVPNPTPEAGPVSACAVPAVFATTHWSMVLEAGHSSLPGAQEALETLCRTYWYPLYAYVRRAGRSVEDAQDLTQQFFARLLEKHYFALASRERGRFRSFLLSSLKNFLANEYHREARLKRGGGQALAWLDSVGAEQRFATEPIDASTPETLFEQRWALTLLESALNRLREEYTASGRGLLFDLLKSYVWGEKNAATYADAAAQLDLTEEAIKKAVQRMRQRFRDLLRAEIGQTVATISEVEEELRYLIQVLRR